MGWTTHTSEWIPFRTWEAAPDATLLQAARDSALRDPRFFRTCKRCGELNNKGHMHDSKVCQSCAERYLGVVY